MKMFSKCVTFLILTCGLSAQCFSVHNSKEGQESERYYLKPHEIQIGPNAIYVLIKGQLLAVSKLCSDEIGLFVLSQEIAGKLVKCPNCKRWYSSDYPELHKCSIL